MRNRTQMAACVVAAVAGVAAGDVIYETEGPFGGPFGLWGADVFIQQSVAIRFTPDADYRLDRVGLWFMNNSATEHHWVTVTVRPDDNDGTVSIPGLMEYDTVGFACSAVGWNPVLEQMDSVSRPVLRAGVNYWVVCVSDSPPMEDPVWNFAAHGNGFSTNTDGDQTTWYPGHSGAELTAIIEGTLVTCLPDFNDDGRLDSRDFVAFLNAFTIGDPSADFNGDGSIDSQDFIAFLNAFVAGC